MADIKWIQIKTNMFDDEKIKLIDALPEKDMIFYIWMRLLVQAGKINARGYIFLNEKIPYTDEMLSTIFNRPLNSIRLALQALRDFGLIHISDNHLIKITNWEKHQNVEGMEKVREQNRLRKQKQRAKAKALEAPNKNNDENIEISKKSYSMSCDSHSMSRDSHDIEGGEGDIEIEAYNNTTAPASNVDGNFESFFNDNMGHLITPFELQTLQSYVDCGMNPEVITLALQEAVEKDAREMSYIKAVLSRWLEHGLKTVEAVIDDKRDFKNKKKQKDSIKKEIKENSYSNKKEGAFNNFKQRNYDFKDLEKKLLGWE